MKSQSRRYLHEFVGTVREMTHEEIVHSSSNVEVTRVITGPLENNVYFVRCKSTNETAMIDAPGGDPQLLVSLCEAKSVGRVLITHSHHDHVGAVDALRAASLNTGIGINDADAAPKIDFTIQDGELFSLGDLTVNAIETPGHTPGSMCFFVADELVLFSGDTLFPGGPGATRGSKPNFALILDSIKLRLFDVFDDATVVFPGHGDSTTIGTERPQFDTWRARGW